jgi:hypothetical protein
LLGFALDFFASNFSIDGIGQILRIAIGANGDVFRQIVEGPDVCAGLL